jgi:outer membrane protein assembly factor BamB
VSDLLRLSYDESDPTSSSSLCRQIRLAPPPASGSVRAAMKRLISACAAAFAIGTLLGDHPWPEFRGPTGQGICTATNLPLHWSDSQNVAWKAAVPGNGWSSPVYSDGRLYLTTAAADADSGDLSLQALALDAGTGAIVWNTTVFTEKQGRSPSIHSKNSHASPTPLLSDGRLIVHFGHEGTASLDLEGRVVWKQTSLRYPPVHGNGGSPVRVGDLVFFSCDASQDPFVVALEFSTGNVRWKTPRITPAAKKFSFCTALVITNAGRTEIISPGSGAVCAYAPDDGHELWRVRYGEGYSVVPRPVFGHGLLYLSSGFDRPVAMAVRPGGDGDLTASNVAWSIAKQAPNTPSMCLVGDEVYMVSDGGIATCADAVSGAVIWSERLAGNFSASPIFGEGRVFFQSEEGVGYVVKAGRKFELLASNDLRRRSLASYAATDGAFFIRTDDSVFRIQAAP